MDNYAVRKYKKVVAAWAAVFALAGTSSAELIFHDFTVTSTTMSFTLQGTVDAVAGNDTDSFFMGVVGDDSWMLGTSRQVSAVYNSGDYDIDNIGGVYQNSTYGTYLYTNQKDYWAIEVGESVDISLSWSGAFDETFDYENNFIIQAGYNTAPVLGSGTPTGSVPEPSSISLIAVAAGAVLFIRRRLLI